MKKSNNRGAIYIYIIFLVTVLLFVMTFISKYIFGNLAIYDNIKGYFILYGKELGLNEEILVNYYDNPKNLNYIDSKYYNRDKFVSRFKDGIEYTLDKGESYELSLTSLDEEYNNKLSKLKYLDIYWNTSINKCNMYVSMIKWEKENIDTISNNKVLLDYNKNNTLLYAFGNLNKLNLLFTTGAYYNSGNLISNNLALNNNSINSISGSLDNYELTLSGNINSNLINIINIKENMVKDINGNYFDSDNVLIKLNSNIYKNRFRLKDSFGSIDKLKFDYKVFIKAEDNCEFFIEGYDNNNILVKIPDNKINGELKTKYIDYKNINIERTIKVGNIELSDYLYKFY